MNNYCVNIENEIKSVGLSINKDISNIRIADVNESIRKKSNTPFGKGTIIIANIENTNPISTYSLRKNISRMLVIYIDLSLLNIFN